MRPFGLNAYSEGPVRSTMLGIIELAAAGRGR